MDALVYSLGDFFTWTFGILESLENLPNIAFILLGFFGLFYWLRQQGKYNKQAAANPNQLK